MMAQQVALSEADFGSRPATATTEYSLSDLLRRLRLLLTAKATAYGGLP